MHFNPYKKLTVINACLEWKADAFKRLILAYVILFSKILESISVKKENPYWTISNYQSQSFLTYCQDARCQKPHANWMMKWIKQLKIKIELIDSDYTETVKSGSWAVINYSPFPKKCQIMITKTCPGLKPI